MSKTNTAFDTADRDRDTPSSLNLGLQLRHELQVFIRFSCPHLVSWSRLGTPAPLNHPKILQRGPHRDWDANCRLTTMSLCPAPAPTVAADEGPDD